MAQLIPRDLSLRTARFATPAINAETSSFAEKFCLWPANLRLTFTRSGWKDVYQQRRLLLMREQPNKLDRTQRQTKPGKEVLGIQE
jgi:hypothetical protein